MGQLVTRVADFSAQLSPSPSHAKKSRGDNPSTPVREGSSKWVCLSEGGVCEVLTHFFWLLAILPSRVPSTPKEFADIVASEDLDFVRGLFAIDRRSLFANTSHILFRAISLISIVVADQNNILGSRELPNERDELRERCE